MNATISDSQIESLLGELPETVETLCERTRALSDDGRVERARDVLERALDRCDHPDLRFELASLHRRSGDAVAAIASLEPIAEGRHPSPRACSMLADLCRQQGDLERAESYRTRLERLEPSDDREDDSPDSSGPPALPADAATTESTDDSSEPHRTSMPEPDGTIDDLETSSSVELRRGQGASSEESLVFELDAGDVEILETEDVSSETDGGTAEPNRGADAPPSEDLEATREKFGDPADATIEQPTSSDAFHEPVAGDDMPDETFEEDEATVVDPSIEPGDLDASDSAPRASSDADDFESNDVIELDADASNVVELDSAEASELALELDDASDPEPPTNEYDRPDAPASAPASDETDAVDETRVIEYDTPRDDRSDPTEEGGREETSGADPFEDEPTRVFEPEADPSNRDGDSRGSGRHRHTSTADPNVGAHDRPNDDDPRSATSTESEHSRHSTSSEARSRHTSSGRESAVSRPSAPSYRDEPSGDSAPERQRRHASESAAQTPRPEDRTEGHTPGESTSRPDSPDERRRSERQRTPSGGQSSESQPRDPSGRRATSPGRHDTDSQRPRSDRVDRERTPSPRPRDASTDAPDAPGTRSRSSRTSRASHSESTPTSPPSRERDDDSNRWPKPWARWRPEELDTRRIVAIGAFAAVLVAVALFAGYRLDRGQTESALRSTLDTIESASESDTYREYERALRAADATLREAQDGLVFGIFDGGAPLHRLQRRLRERHVRLKAMMAYRFEPGARSGLEAALERLDTGEVASATTLEARIYRALTDETPRRAVEIAERARTKYSDRVGLISAGLVAHLETGESRAIARAARRLESLDGTRSIYQRYLLTRVARHREDVDALGTSTSLLSAVGESHLDARIERVRALIAARSHDEARRRARQLIEEHTHRAAPLQLVRLHHALGHAHLALGDEARAEEQFRRAVDVASTRTGAYLPLLDLYLQQGRLDRVDHYVERARERAQNVSALAERRARLAFHRGDFARVEDLLGAIGDPPDAPVLRGRMRLARGTYRDAISSFERARDASGYSDAVSSQVETFELLARARLEGETNIESLVDRMARIVADHRDDSMVLRTAARLRVHAARLADDDSTRLRHLKKAKRHLERADRLEPDDALTHYARCELLTVWGRLSSAERACRKGREGHPRYSPGIVTFARLYLQRGRPEKAVELMASLHDDHAGQPEVVEWYVRSLVRAGRTDRAQEILDRWLREKGTSKTPRYRFLEGRVAFEQGDYVQAIGYLSELEDEARSIRRAEADLYRALTRVRLDDFDEAYSIVRNYLDHPTRDAFAWLIFGELRRRQGRVSDALENLDRAEAALDAGEDARRLEALVDVERAWTWQSRYGWDHSRVARHLEAARARAEETHPEVRLALGLFELRSRGGDLERAVEHLEAVVEHQPYRCRALEALSDLYGRLERPDDADRLDTRLETRCR